jgi:hypothetical protein
MKVAEMVVAQEDGCRKIAISLIDTNKRRTDGASLRERLLETVTAPMQKNRPNIP